MLSNTRFPSRELTFQCFICFCYPLFFIFGQCFQRCFLKSWIRSKTQGYNIKHYLLLSSDDQTETFDSGKMLTDHSLNFFFKECLSRVPLVLLTILRFNWVIITYVKRIFSSGDFPGCLVVKTPSSQFRGPKFDSLVRELDPTCCNRQIRLFFLFLKKNFHL